MRDRGFGNPQGRGHGGGPEKVGLLCLHVNTDERGRDNARRGLHLGSDARGLGREVDEEGQVVPGLRLPAE